MKYNFFATLFPDGDMIGVKFDDIDGLVTYGKDYLEAVKSAQEALEGWLLVAEDFGDDIPQASQPSQLNVKAGESLVLVSADTKFAREREDNKLVKKTLTIPNYLNVLGVEKGINFSQVLSDTLKKELVEA
jgi:predicted RNase H-like HicB family nuclease